MNHFYLCLGLLAIGGLTTTSVNAQENSFLLNFTEQYDAGLGQNFPLPSSGYLYDRVYPVLDLDKVEPCDTMDINQTVQAWWEIRQSNIQVDIADLSYEKKELLILNHTEQLAIVGFDYQGERMNAELYESEDLYWEEDILNCKPNVYPFKPIQSSGLALSKSQLFVNEKYPIFLRSDLFISNTVANIQEVQLNVEGSNDVLRIFPGDTIWLSFPYEGNIHLDLEAHLDDGRTICSKTEVTTKIRQFKTDVECEDGFRYIVESDIPYKGMLEEKATTSLADAHIYYHKSPGNDCKIIKPAIIVDGFDPLDRRDFEDIRNTVNYVDFNTVEKNLVYDLQNKGYDVIILNFPILGSDAIQGRAEIKQYKDDGSFDRFVNKAGRDGGADYIQRNAFLTVKLIQMVNQMLADNESDEELVVIGPSMGGLITRYALAYMEKQHALGVPNMDHNTRLWLSFDSPHNGANIPLSTQLFVDYEGGFFGNQEVAQMFGTRLRSVAARQMLHCYFDAIFTGGDFHSEAMFKAFYRDLESNGLPNSDGWPQNTRRSSVLNGALSNPVSWQAGDKDISLDMQGYGKKFAQFDFKYDMNYQSSGSVAEFNRILFEEESGTYDRHKTLTSPKWPDIEIDYKKASYPFPFPVDGEKVYVKSFQINVHHYNNNPHGNLDIVQGAKYPQVTEITNKILNNLQEKKRSNFTINTYQTGSDFTFIPSISAAGLRDPHIPYNSILTRQELLCENLTYFDNMYVPPTNEYHVQVTADNAKWILEEITRSNTSCPKFCPEQNNWPDVMCKDEVFNFQLSSFPANQTFGITWRTDNELQILSGQHTTQVPVKAVQSNPLDVYFDLYTDISPECAADFTIKHTVHIPNTRLNVSGSHEICAFNEHYISSSLSESSDHFWFYGDVNGIYRTTNPYSTIYAPSNSSDPGLSMHTDFGGARLGNYTLYVEAENICGETMTGQKGVTILPKSACSSTLKENSDESFEEVTIFPNPTSDWWMVATSSNNPILSYELIGINGSVLKRDILKEPVAVLDVSAQDLPQGIYLLRLRTPDGVFVRRITRNLD
ncbi:MAG: T9SS type A sorting domain-containing protein [Bacteroidetes bacterium]|nr:T9SS type A sorting domain-containing protein [Bacteroidota bacterium]